MLYLNINLIKWSSGTDLCGFAARRARLSLPIEADQCSLASRFASPAPERYSINVSVTFEFHYCCSLI